MTFLLNLPTLLRLARRSVSTPREGARMMMDLDIPRGILIQFYLLELVFSAILKTVVYAMVPAPDGIAIPPDAAISLTIVEAVIGIAVAFAAYRVGRAFGGTGSFDQSLTLVVWAQFILLCFSAVQVVAMLLLPPFTDILMLVGLALFFWLAVHFVAELHGFQSLGLVFGGIILSLLGMTVLMAILFSAMGLRIL